MDAALKEGRAIPEGEMEVEKEKDGKVESITRKEETKERRMEDCEEVKKTKDKQEVKTRIITPPLNAEGKPISVDQHWKQFISKHPTKKEVKKRSSVEKNTDGPEKTSEEPKVKKAKTLFDDEPEVESRKKIPLRRKK